jgi:subtilase family serine protease
VRTYGRALSTVATLAMFTTMLAIGTRAGTAGAQASPSDSYKVMAALPARQATSVIVALPLRNQGQLQSLMSEQVTAGSPEYHHWLTPAEFQAGYGVLPGTVRSLEASLSTSGLTVSAFGAQAVKVTGTTQDIDAAFGADLAVVQRADGSVATATLRPMVTPAPLRSLGAVVEDLSPVVRLSTTSKEVPQNAVSPYGGYWGYDLKQAYQFPAFGSPAAHKADGAGQTIGIVMSSPPNPKDLQSYFAQEKLPVPNVSLSPVLGGSKFSKRNGGSFEVDLDVQQSTAMAPDASVVVYDMPDLSDQSVFAAYTQVAEADQVDVVSGSFGGCELAYTPAYNNGVNLTGVLRALDDLFVQTESEGITTIFSSGDNGGLDCPSPAYFEDPGAGTTTPFVKGVEFPADSPNVVAVGGTNLKTTYSPGSDASNYVSENAEADTLVPYDPYGLGNLASGGYWGSGGGFSAVFAPPSWQKAIGIKKGRSVPDVALHMGGCPGGISLVCGLEDSYDFEYFAGKLVGVIGTSASAPDFAGTVALLDQVDKSRMGNVDPMLYAFGSSQRAGTLPYPVFHDDIPGFNGYYDTGYTQNGGRSAAFDQVLGNGTLIAKDFIFGSGSTPAAGDPFTASNP